MSTPQMSTDASYTKRIVVGTRRFPVVVEPWTPHALPTFPNLAGRPIWEPPILNYTKLIDEEYDKKREAALKFTDGDVAKTTGIMDYHTEIELVRMQKDWAGLTALFLKDPESKSFFAELVEELEEDWRETLVRKPLKGGQAHFYRREDGTYVAGSVRTMLSLEMGFDPVLWDPNPRRRCRKGFVDADKAQIERELPAGEVALLPEDNVDDLGHAKEDGVNLREASPARMQRRSRICLSCLSRFGL